MPSMVLIFDGSGSMWGKLDGQKQTKLVDAREAVKSALSKLNPATTQIGLVAFGHRRQGDCSDVQIVVPLEAATASAFVERIMTPLDKLNPRGKGPLTAALREAAKVLAKADGPRSIVLLHDDPDNCQQDTCAALDELQKSAPGVVIHVVGLGLKPEDATRYQCLTNPTGGRSVNAMTAEQMEAAITDVMGLAAAGTTEMARGVETRLDSQTASIHSVSVAAIATPVPAPEPAPALETTGPPRLKLRAYLTADRLLRGYPVRWSVWPLDQSAAVALRADGDDAEIPVQPGTYRVEARAGLQRAETTVVAKAQGQTAADVQLNATDIRLTMPLPADATATLVRRLPESEGQAPTTSHVSKPDVAFWPHGQTSLVVAAGAYWLRLEQGELSSKRPIDLMAGQSLDLDLSQPGGRVVLSLTAPAGPAAATTGALANQPVIFKLEEDDPDAPRGRREIARSAAAVAEFVVAPGTYVATATRGSIDVRERITVNAGEVVRRSLPLMAARLVVSAKIAAASTGASSSDAATDSFSVTRLDFDATSSTFLGGPAAIVDLPAGRYRIEARRNNAALRTQQDVELKAGDFRALTIEHQAGQLRLDAGAEGDGAGDGVAWHVLDGGGRLVWSAYEPRTTTLLGVGRYTVRANIHGRQVERTIEVRTGQVSDVRIGLQ